MVFWSRAHRTTRIKQPLSVDSRELDELARVEMAQDALMAKLEKLVGSDKCRGISYRAIQTGESSKWHPAFSVEMASYR